QTVRQSAMRLAVPGQQQGRQPPLVLDECLRQSRQGAPALSAAEREVGWAAIHWATGASECKTPQPLLAGPWYAQQAGGWAAQADGRPQREAIVATLEIIGAPQSNFVCTTRIACMEKGVPYTLNPARPHTPEVDAVHPLGRIPAMRHGDVTL